jgi:hypothetical protein
MAPCSCMESVLPDQAKRMEPALYAQELGLTGRRKGAEYAEIENLKALLEFPAGSALLRLAADVINK